MRKRETERRTEERSGIWMREREREKKKRERRCDLRNIEGEVRRDGE